MIVPPTGKIYGDLERKYAHEAVDDGVLTGGRWADLFARRLCDFTGRRFCVLVNSGSSANLIACQAWSEIFLPYRGVSIRTGVLGFPTTLSSTIQAGLIPTFEDIKLPGLNIAETGYFDFLVHTLGYLNTPHKYSTNQQSIEDACDALGTVDTQRTLMTTHSFYPAHHITTGEGGAVMTDDPKVYKILCSLRDWGRACWCKPGCDNTCGKRFNGDYDHKYTYDRIGYNLKMTEMQASIGCAQMEQLPGFIERRVSNFEYLWSNLEERGMSKYFMLPPRAQTSPFAFWLLCKPPVKRNELCKWLDSQGVGNRPIMGGNLLRQPAFQHLGNHEDIIPMLIMSTSTDFMWAAGRD
jgi:CDP-6-deoxy-D-xylo-4-hexulose-3-dehydrase